MKIEFAPIAGDVGGFSVRLCEDDEEATDGTELGHVHRGEKPDEWTFVAFNQVGGAEPPGPLSFTARGMKELRDWFQARFSSVEIKASRLTQSTMQDYAESVMQGLYQLAQETDAHAGFLAAMADTLAVAITEDFNGADQKTLDLFFTQTKTRIATRRRAEEVRGDLHAKLRAMFGDVVGDSIGARRGSDKSEDSTKH